MYAIRIVFPAGEINLNYTDWQRAKAAYDRLVKAEELDFLEATDDYNRSAWFFPSSASYILLQDLDREVDCAVDLSNLQRKANNRVGMQQGISAPPGIMMGKRQ